MDRSNCKECKGKGWSRQTLAYGVKVNEPCELCELRPAETQEPVSMTSQTVVPDPRACNELGYDFDDTGDMTPVAEVSPYLSLTDKEGEALDAYTAKLNTLAEKKRAKTRALYTRRIRTAVIRLRSSLRDNDSDAFMRSNYITHAEQENLDKAIGSLATAAIHLDRLAIKLDARDVEVTRKETT